MADSKVSELTVATAATTDDLLYIVDAGTTSKKITFDNLQKSVAHATLSGVGTAQAHTDYLLNSGVDEAVGPITITADNSSADTAYVPMVLYNTDATPPAANTVPIGTIYIQYTP